MMTIHKNADRFVQWYRNDVLPLWIKNSYDDENGGFYEALNFDGSPSVELDRRVRVQARQIYVMSRVASLGWHKEAGALAEKGFEYFLTHACLENGETGCAHVLNPKGGIINDKRDLYDQAFLLLSCASMYSYNKSKSALTLADRTIAYMETTLRAPNGGWFEDDNFSLPRRQNPHMHLFEAFMALYVATDDEKYVQYADLIFTIFKNHFFDPKESVLREFFQNDWSYSAGKLGSEIEPGHMMEWVYLLRVYERLRGVNVSEYCGAMYNRAKEIGTAPNSPFLVDKLQIGEAPDGTRRLWPQTEYIKAACLSAAFTNDETLIDASALINECFKTYFAEPVEGLWCDQFDAKGLRLAPNAPASILYHLLDAIIAVDTTILSTA